MSYIDLINKFWDLDEAWQFTCPETRLYFYLVKTANRLGWVDSWIHSDDKTSANVGVSRNTLKTARNRLSQAGLISFKEGGKGKGNKTRYHILIPKVEPNPYPNVTPKADLNHNLHLNKNKTRLDNIVDDKSSTCPTSKSDAEKIDWPQLVNWVNGKINGVYGQIRLPLSDKRKQLIGRRISDHGKDTFCKAITKATESEFLRNSTFCNFDWIIKPTNFEKIISGNYDNKNKHSNSANGIDETFIKAVAEGCARGKFENTQGQ